MQLVVGMNVRLNHEPATDLYTQSPEAIANLHTAMVHDIQ